MSIALSTGWPPDVVRDLTMSELEALGDVMKERARALKGR
jgi:hypothetical protein